MFSEARRQDSTDDRSFCRSGKQLSVQGLWRPLGRTWMGKNRTMGIPETVLPHGPINDVMGGIMIRRMVMSNRRVLNGFDQTS